MIINGCNCLKPTHIKQFLDNFTDDDEIGISIENKDMFLSTKKTFLDSLFKHEYDNDDSVTCIGLVIDAELTIKGIDVNWWKESTRRKNKMYAYDGAKPETTKTEKVYSIAVGDILRDAEGEYVDNVVSFSGNKKIVLEKLNFQIRMRTIKQFYKSAIVICLDFHDNDDDDWKTLDELEKEGSIKLWESK